MSDTEKDTPVGVEQEPPARSDEDRELAERLVAEANEQGLDLVGPDGVLTGLTKRVLEAGLEAEMTEHLGYDKHAVEGRDGGNSRWTCPAIETRASSRSWSRSANGGCMASTRW